MCWCAKGNVNLIALNTSYSLFPRINLSMEFGLNQTRASLEQNEFVNNKVIARFMKNIYSKLLIPKKKKQGVVWCTKGFCLFSVKESFYKHSIGHLTLSSALFKWIW